VTAPASMKTNAIRALLGVVLAALATAFWQSSHMQRHIFADVSTDSELVGRLSGALLQAESSIQALLARRDADTSARFLAIERQLTMLEAAIDPGAEARALPTVETAARRYLAVADETTHAVHQDELSTLPALEADRTVILHDFEQAADRLLLAMDEHRKSGQRGARILLWSVIGALGFGGVFALVVVERRGRAARRRRDGETRLTEILQVARSEDEAYRVLARHVEQVVDSGSHAVVLNRNNSENRLEPRTPLDQHPELTEPLEGAAPDSCLAIRLSKPHERGRGDDPLMPCHVCGNLPTRSTCIPTLAGGEVIGSVLVEHDKRLRASTLEQLVMAVASAAPVIANLRSLAVAETRAATDALTGLANNRSIQDTLKRMVAHANRSDTPLAAILFDLDLFKQINDTYGHERGDEALAAVAAVATTSVRGSDFVGRWGGEEFLVLLPDTDHDGAAHVAEKMRDAIAHITLEGIERQLTASFGVAALPHDADDGSSLLRSADRALYRAKSNGRNRVETLDHTTPPQPELTLTSGSC